eukprot:scaffold7641_cov277-Pinguiococcus_pyrenoidosus.AAC.2
MPDINPSARGARGRKRAAKPDEHTSVTSARPRGAQQIFAAPHSGPGHPRLSPCFFGFCRSLLRTKKPRWQPRAEVERRGAAPPALRSLAAQAAMGSLTRSVACFSLDTGGNWTFEHQGVDPKLLQELEAQLAVKPVDQEKIYQTVSNDIREELLGNLVRYLLMRSSRKRQITRTDINNDVMGKFRGMRGLLNHLLLRADEYLRKVFGYQIVVGSWVDDKTSGTFYLYNTIAEVGEGVEVAAMEHLAEVQNGSGQRAAVAERGLLMVTLALSLHGGNDGVAEQILIDRLRQIDSSIRPGNSDSLRMHGDINKAGYPAAPVVLTRCFAACTCTALHPQLQDPAERLDNEAEVLCQGAKGLSRGACGLLPHRAPRPGRDRETKHPELRARRAGALGRSENPGRDPHRRGRRGSGGGVDAVDAMELVTLYRCV